MIQPEPKGFTQGNFIVRIAVVRYDGVECDKGIMPTKIELTLEQSQQGVSNDVLVSIEGVEELKRNVWIKGKNKEAIPTLKAETESIHMLSVFTKVKSGVYYVERLRHNLSSVGQLCDADLEVAFQKHSYFIRDLDGVDLLKGSLGLNLPMRVESIHGKKYILVIVDDFSRFTWVKFLCSKDEIPEFVIKFLKKVQVSLNATIRNIRTDNGTEFVNQTLKSYYEDVGVSHQTTVAHTLQQNGVIERQNRILVEATHKIDHGDNSCRFDELTAMASEEFDSGPTLQLLTPGYISSGLVQNLVSPTPYVSPSKKD
nr:integrase, catalytic region, zinc finger, CCHC-type, peptidase aspartic, catalytic [Tanacetum cinerariifolium]